MSSWLCLRLLGSVALAVSPSSWWYPRRPDCFHVVLALFSSACLRPYRLGCFLMVICCVHSFLTVTIFSWLSPLPWLCPIGIPTLFYCWFPRCLGLCPCLINFDLFLVPVLSASSSLSGSVSYWPRRRLVSHVTVTSTTSSAPRQHHQAAWPSLYSVSKPLVLMLISWKSGSQRRWQNLQIIAFVLSRCLRL